MKIYSSVVPPVSRLIALTAISLSIAQPADAQWVESLIRFWNYGPSGIPPQQPTQWHPRTWQPTRPGEQPQNQLPQTPPRQRFQRERAGIILSPLSRSGLEYLLFLGGNVDEQGWLRRPFRSRDGFGVDMAPGRYQMQASWSPTLTILLDVDDRYQIVWISFYFYDQRFYY